LSPPSNQTQPTRPSTASASQYRQSTRVAPPILLLHGFPTSSHLYRNIFPEVGKTHRAIALDLPGYGLSDKPLDVAYGYDFYADTLDAFLDALGTSRAIGRQPIDAEARNPNHTR